MTPLRQSQDFSGHVERGHVLGCREHKETQKMHEMVDSGAPSTRSQFLAPKRRAPASGPRPA